MSAIATSPRLRPASYASRPRRPKARRRHVHALHQRKGTGAVATVRDIDVRVAKTDRPDVNQDVAGEIYGFHLGQAIQLPPSTPKVWTAGDQV